MTPLDQDRFSGQDFLGDLVSFAGEACEKRYHTLVPTGPLTKQQRDRLSQIRKRAEKERKHKKRLRRGKQ